MEYSARHKKRLLKAAKEKWISKLTLKNNTTNNLINNATNKTTNNTINETINNTSIETVYDIASVPLCETRTTAPEFEEEVLPHETQLHKNEKLIKDLGQWQQDSHTSNKNMRSLLLILQNYGCQVPISPSSLIPKVNIRPDIITVEPGKYIHFGIKNTLQKVSHIFEEYDEIICDINIDGLPLYKSSQMQLWPILIRITNVENVDIFPVGVYCGKKKPESVETYLKPLVEEIFDFQQNKIILGTKAIAFKIRALICDAPAKAYVCGIVHHSSKHGCSKCTQLAKKIKYVLVYSTQIGELMDDVIFFERRFKNHHQINFLDKLTPFEKINLKMVSQVPLDPMHLIDLGVTKKMISRLYKNKVSLKISLEDKKKLSQLLISIKKYITKDFTRYPRELEELSNWKATEYRQLLLYTGIVVLKDFVSDDFYYEFLLLHCSIRLLSCPRNYVRNISTAHNLLQLFVENFPIVFGSDSVTYNVHGLLHICACVQQMGSSLYSFSAYDFENYLQLMKKNVHKPREILQQLFKKHYYKNITKSTKTLGINEKNLVINSYTTDKYTFTVKSPNNICLTVPYAPMKIFGFRKNSDDSVLFIGRYFKNINPFFEEPMNSMAALGISIADNDLEDDIVEKNFNEIDCKLLSLPYKSKLVFIPILHGCT